MSPHILNLDPEITKIFPLWLHPSLFSLSLFPSSFKISISTFKRIRGGGCLVQWLRC